MKLWNRLLIHFFALIFFASEVSAAPSLRHKKLLPLDASGVAGVVACLRSNDFPEVALYLEMQTANEKISGKMFAKKLQNQLSVRLEFAGQVYLSSKTSVAGILTSEKERSLTVASSVSAKHLLRFDDILMTFLSWEKYEYRNVRRVQGRNTHTIRFFSANGDSVDVAYDPVFSAILRVEYLSKAEDRKVVRTFNLLNFKKIRNTWLMKSIEIKNCETSETTIVDVSRAAVEQILPDTFFDDANLIPVKDEGLIYDNV